MAQKICCGGFELGDGLQLDGVTLSATGGGSSKMKRFVIDVEYNSVIKQNVGKVTEELIQCIKNNEPVEIATRSKDPLGSGDKITTVFNGFLSALDYDDDNQVCYAIGGTGQWMNGKIPCYLISIHIPTLDFRSSLAELGYTEIG